MPSDNDTISRSAAKYISRAEAVATAMEAIATTYINRQWGSTDDFRFEATKAVATALNSLPAAEADELDRWKLHTFGPYKGYYGAATHPDHMFHGRVLLERDIVTFAADTLEDLEAAFQGSVDDYLEWTTPSPPAAEGSERQYDEHRQPICNHCGKKTNSAYAKHVKLQCWNCGNYLPELNSGTAAQLRGEG